MESNETPWAVICRVHGQQFLTRENYNRQLRKADSRWECPHPQCRHPYADWDDANFEAKMGHADGGTGELTQEEVFYFRERITPN